MTKQQVKAKWEARGILIEEQPTGEPLIRHAESGVHRLGDLHQARVEWSQADEEPPT